MKTSTVLPMIVYLIELPREIYWSSRKMTAAYHHVQYQYKDRARMKEMEAVQFSTYANHGSKKVTQLEN